MDASTRQVVVALQEIIKQHKAAAAVETGDEAADEAYALGAGNVIEDLEALIQDLDTGFHEFRSERPHIPMGFRLHSVATH